MEGVRFERSDCRLAVLAHGDFVSHPRQLAFHQQSQWGFVVDE
jgi:hypothetical protein